MNIAANPEIRMILEKAKETFVLCVSVLSGNQNRLNQVELDTLGITPAEGMPYDYLHLAEKDFCWRSQVLSGLNKGMPIKVDQVDVRNACIAKLWELLLDISAKELEVFGRQLLDQYHEKMRTPSKASQAIPRRTKK